MVETGDGKKDNKVGFSSLNEAFVTYGENKPDSSLPHSIFELPEPSPALPSPELTIIEKMHLEEQLLRWDEPEHRKNGADALIELAKTDDVSLPTICRIRDILSFHNKRLGGEEVASQLRKAKLLVENRLFKREDTLPFPHPPREGAQPRNVKGGKQSPIKK